jgi:hypothetical protein
MRYKQITPHLGIPVVGKGDRIMADLEIRKYTIIENMLIAGTQGLSEVVFDDGTYKLVKDGDRYDVSVTAGGTYPSMHGIVGGFYFKAAAKVKWDNLKPGYFYYLYVKATPKTPYENSAVRLSSSTVPLGKGALLMATVNLRDGEVLEVDTNPDGKVYSADVARHASDSSNPHGRKLEQEELFVTSVLTLAADAKVQIGGRELTTTEFAEAAAEVAGLTTEVVDFETGGTDGVLLTASGKVRSVQVHRRAPLDSSVGEFAIGYFGDDDSVDKESEFIFYNNGDKGLPMRAVVTCGS